MLTPPHAPCKQASKRGSRLVQAGCEARPSYRVWDTEVRAPRGVPALKWRETWQPTLSCSRSDSGSHQLRKGDKPLHNLDYTQQWRSLSPNMGKATTSLLVFRQMAKSECLSYFVKCENVDGCYVSRMSMHALVTPFLEGYFGYLISGGCNAVSACVGPGLARQCQVLFYAGSVKLCC